MISFKDYQSAKGINASFLKACLQGAYQGYKYLHESKKPSAEMAFGSALHHYILEPDTFIDHYLVQPKVDRRTKVGKEQAEAFERLANGKEIIDEEDLAKIARIHSRLHDNAIFKDLYANTYKEASYFAEFVDGHQYKARFDMVNPSSGIIVDLKTTRSADRVSFTRDIFNLGYDLQMLHYANVLGCNHPLRLPSCLIVAIEKDSEQIAYYDLSEIAYSDYTQKRYEKALKTAHQVLTLNHCPNKYDETITRLTMPIWLEGSDQ